MTLESRESVTPARKPRYRRRIVWLGILILLLLVAYAAGWFWAAGRLEAEANKAIAGIDRDPVRAECANLHAAGFPFRIGLFCDRVSFRDERGGSGIEAGAFRSAAQVYDPFLVVGELDGPAKVQAPDLPPLDVTWDIVKASVRIDRPLPDRISTEARKLRVSGPDGVLVTADDLQSHLRPNGADLDYAASMQGLALAPALVKGRTVPPLAGSLDVTLKDGVAWLIGQNKSLRGRSGTLRNGQLIFSPNASLALSGPFSVDQEGRLNADLKLGLTGAPEVGEALAQILPDQGGIIRTAFSNLAVLGSGSALPLTIRDGRIGIAFIKLGKVPPLP